MKKEYLKPTAEKINFDYVESVVACPSGCPDPSHPYHYGEKCGSCGQSAGNSGNSGVVDPTTHGHVQQPTCHYAPGWGLGC